MTTQKEILACLAKLLPQIRKQYGVKKIGLFGSFARNEARADSDVDLLVEFQHPIGWEFCDLKDLLENRTNRRVDLVTVKALKKQLRKDVLGEVIYP